MTDRFQAHAFIAGELDRPFYARTDLEKYDLGVALASNFFTDYRGGMKSRQGFLFADACEPGSRVFTFRTGTALNDILILLSLGKMRFMSGGSYLVETTKDVSGVVGNVVTCSAHGYSTGDYVVLTGAGCPDYTYKITVLTSNTFSILFPWDAAPPAVTATGGTVARVLTIVTEYNSGLQTIRMDQKHLTATFSHMNRPQYELTLEPESGVWTFAQIQNDAPAEPTSLVMVPSGSGAAYAVYAVSTVSENGVESVPIIGLLSASVNFVATAGSVSITWDGVPGVSHYRIYRSLVTENEEITLAQPLGLIGETFAPNLIDNNIVPDFSQSPITQFNPFARGAILSLDVTSGGSGYTHASYVSVAGGVGFRGFPIVVGGELTGVVITCGGSGFELDDVVSVSGGTGAVVTIGAVSPLSGNNPSTSTTFQQRRVSAGTKNLPMTIFASRPGAPNNYDSSSDPAANDAYVLTIDAPTVVPIKHLVPMRDGLLVLHEEGIDRITAATGKAISATNNYLENQIRSGIGDADPVLIDNDLLYALEEGGGVRALAYTIYSESFAPQNISVLAAHLFAVDKYPRRMVWIEEPDRLMWVVRSDGRFLSLTYLREQEVRAWTQHWTRGYVRDICALKEGTKSILYAVIERENFWSVERLSDRNFLDVEEGVFVDSALQYQGERRFTRLSIFERTNGTGWLTWGTGDFLEEDLGKVIRAQGGKYIITAVTSENRVEVDIERFAKFNLPGTNRVTPSYNWTISEPQTVFGNLWHLEGEKVSVLADGDVYLNIPVVNGEIELEHPASYVSIGLPYTAELKTLPLTRQDLQSDGRRKRIVGTAARVDETRGLEAGPDGGPFYEMKDKGDEYLDAPIPLRDDSSYVFIGSRWMLDSSIVFRQLNPLPATILGLVTEVEIED